MQRAALALALALSSATLPETAAAIECALMPPDFRQIWWSYADVEGKYVLVWGRFSDLRSPRFDRDRQMMVWQATFTGMSSSKRAFDDPFSANVTIHESFLSEDEPETNPSSRLDEYLPQIEGLVFLEVTPGGYSFGTGICGSDIYPGEENIPSALDCIHGRRCARPKQ